MPNHPTRLSRLRDFKIRSPGFSPAASPVNRQTRQDAGVRMARLAESLQSLAPGLRQYARQKDQIQDAEEAQDAEKAFEKLREADMTYKEAIKEGVIQEHQSPIFRARLQELQGRQRGEEAMHAWNVYKAENIPDASTLDEFDTAFDEFIADYSEERLQDAPPALERSFMQTVRDQILGDREQFSANAGQRIVGRATEEFSTTMFSGALNRLDQTPEEIAAWASNTLEAQQAHTGIDSPRRRMNNIAAFNALMDAAIRAPEYFPDDPGAAMRLFRAAQMIPSGTGTLGAAPWAQEKIERTSDLIDENRRQVRQRQAVEAQEDVELIISDYRDSFWDSPNDANLLRRQAARKISNLGLRNDTTAAALDSLDRQHGDLQRAWFQKSPSDPTVLDTVSDRVWANPADLTGNMSAITEAAIQGDLSQTDARALRNDAIRAQQTSPDQIAGAEGTMEYVLDHPEYKWRFREFRASLSAGGFMSEFNNNDKLMRTRGVAAYNSEWHYWAEQNPDKLDDYRAVNDFETDLRERLLTRFGPKGIGDLEAGQVYDPSGDNTPRTPEGAWESRVVMDPAMLEQLDALYNGNLRFTDLGDAEQQRLRGIMGQFQLNMDNLGYIRVLIEKQKQLHERLQL